MQMMFLFWVSSQPIILSGTASLIHWLDKKPSLEMFTTLIFYAIFINLSGLNKYDQ